jgi:hypothetical protein
VPLGILLDFTGCRALRFDDIMPLLFFLNISGDNSDFLISVFLFFIIFFIFFFFL